MNSFIIRYINFWLDTSGNCAFTQEMLVDLLLSSKDKLRFLSAYTMWDKVPDCVYSNNVTRILQEKLGEISKHFKCSYTIDRYSQLVTFKRPVKGFEFTVKKEYKKHGMRVMTHIQCGWVDGIKPSDIIRDISS